MNIHSYALLALLAVGLVLPVSDLAAQVHPDDIRWWDGFGRAGVDGTVHAIYEFQGDLVLGGEFNRVVDTRSQFVARHRAEIWEDIGSGLLGYQTGEHVEVLAEYGGQLIAAGWLLSSGFSDNYVGIFDGSSWTRLGGAFLEVGTVSTVFDLVEFNADLIAAGRFSMVGTTDVAGVARWDGSAWQGMGAGTGPDIRSLAVLDDDLYSAGILETATPDGGSGVLRWDGSAWSLIGGAFFGDSDPQLVVYDGALHAAGSFIAIGGVPFDGIARWNGDAWEAMPPAPLMITAITATSTHIYAAGWEPGPRRVVQQWDGLQWSILGDDIENSISALGTWQSRPIIGGDFVTIGSQICYGLALWESGQWKAFGGGHGVQGGIECQLGGTTLHVGGTGLSMDGLGGTILAEWDGQSWQPRGGNVLTDGVPFRLQALGHHAGQIIAALQIKNAQVVTETRLASLDEDGQSWTVLGDITRTGSTWASVPVISSYQDALLIGGNFDAVNGTNAPHLAQWDGVVWSAFGLDPGGPVSQLVVYQGQVVIMGEWDGSNGGGNLDGPILWDGMNWLPLPMGDIDYLGTQALGVHQGQLLAAVRAWVDGDLLNFVRVWDGSTWSTLGEGFSDHVLSLCSYEEELYAGGAFSWIGSTLQRGVGRWDGISWNALGSGLDPYAWVTSFGVAGADLYLGGTILRAGGQASVGIARWKSDEIVTVPPQDLPGSIDRIESIAPNPFNPRTTISFECRNAGHVQLSVYDLAGRQVAILVEGWLGSGHHEEAWNGRDITGRPVAAGQYLIKLKTVDRIDVQKVTLTK